MEMPQPNLDILAKKSVVVAALLKVMARDAVIDDPSETRVYECDALTAYKCAPMIVVLPTSTQEVSDVLKICQRKYTGGPPWRRNLFGRWSIANCRLCDIGIAKINKVLETDYDNRLIKVQTGRTNLSVYVARLRSEVFFYAP